MKVLRKSDWIIIPSIGKKTKKNMVPNHQPVFLSSLPPVLHDLLGASDQPASPKEVHEDEAWDVPALGTSRVSMEKNDEFLGMKIGI